MADSGNICGACCLIIFSSLNTWCSTQAFGANGCCNSNATAGCCGSCCNSSFDDDGFDDQVKKNLEETRDPNAPTPDMSEQVRADTNPTVTT